MCTSCLSRMSACDHQEKYTLPSHSNLPDLSFFSNDWKALLQWLSFFKEWNWYIFAIWFSEEWYWFPTLENLIEPLIKLWGDIDKNWCNTLQKTRTFSERKSGRKAVVLIWKRNIALFPSQGHEMISVKSFKDFYFLLLLFLELLCSLCCFYLFQFTFYSSWVHSVQYMHVKSWSRDTFVMWGDS